MAHFGIPKGTESIRGGSFLHKAILKSYAEKSYPFEPYHFAPLHLCVLSALSTGIGQFAIVLIS
ncbi:hypothetical protein ALO81_200139 [Pseudomonas cannabina]|uniref:Transcriptional regulator n=1 Tax=Pseudomonas cannabina TaxID=86840 RepID=A0A0P9QMC5_PSECA|nr:hypothetical protein ALO81_200139 [Pseudomonas cannabina]